MASLPIFQKILNRAKELGTISTKNKESIGWLNKKASQVNKPEPEPNSSAPSIGSLYFIEYSAKHYPNKLPYYDRYPIILIIGITPDGFLGLNFHYLPPRFRAQLFQALLTLETYNFETEQRKIQATYELLRSVQRYKYFRPCIKRYLASHIKSVFIKLEAQEWEIALFLPTERFVGATKEEAWDDSRNIIRKYEK